MGNAEWLDYLSLQTYFLPNGARGFNGRSGFNFGILGILGIRGRLGNFGNWDENLGSLTSFHGINNWLIFLVQLLVLILEFFRLLITACCDGL
jgi:hypothetical protein